MLGWHGLVRLAMRACVNGVLGFERTTTDNE